MKDYPEIRIVRGHLLEGYFNISGEGIDEHVEQCRTAWVVREASLMSQIKVVTGLTYSDEVLAVHLLDKARHGSISSPLIIGAGVSVDDFVMVLAHEFIHNLSWDNKQNDDWSAKIRELYPNETRSAAIHVMVHAILALVLTPEEIKRDIEHSQKWPDYKRAWEIVQHEGAEEIIKKLKRSDN